MMGFTTNQWAVLALVLVAGWLLGLLSRSGGARWRRAYEEEHARRKTLEQAQDARLAAANARVAELERTAPPISHATGATIAAAARGNVDDLTPISGIDRAEEVRLNDAGILRYRDITKMTATEEAALEGRLGYEPGLIAHERWREQAELLAAGKLDEHRRLFA